MLQCTRARERVGGRPPRLLFVLAVLFCVTLGVAASASAYTTLKPGETMTISQALKVNVVLVGFEPGTGMQQVDQSVYWQACLLSSTSPPSPSGLPIATT